MGTAADGNSGRGRRESKNILCVRLQKDPGERRNHGQAVPEGTDEKRGGIRFER